MFCCAQGEWVEVSSGEVGLVLCGPRGEEFDRGVVCRLRDRGNSRSVLCGGFTEDGITASE